MKPQVETELEIALQLVRRMELELQFLRAFWPKSRRSSSGQRSLDNLKALQAAAALCIRDGLQAVRGG